MTTTPITRPLTTAEVSDLTGVPEATLRYWRTIAFGPVSYSLGRRCVRYDHEDVAAWIAQQKATTSVGGAS